MTRRDQTLRAWIRRPATGATWISYVSFKGRRHEHNTRTTHRRAALEFNILHALNILRPPTTNSETSSNQLHFFHPDSP